MIGMHQMSMAEYQADPAPAPSLSAGIIHRLVAQTPLHAWMAHPKLNKDYKPEEDDKFDLGSCAHAVLLEGEGAIYAIEAPDWRTKAAKEARDLARSQGKIPVLAHKLVAIREMAGVAREALKDVAEIGPIDLSTGKAEHVLIWQEGGIWCRARPDWIGGVMLDYKSTDGSAAAAAWCRNQLMKLGFDTQAVHYSRGYRAITGTRLPFIFMVQENQPPYECSFVGLSNAVLEIAERKWDFALALWAKCMATNKWRGYPRRVEMAEPMAWDIDQDEERRLTFEERLEYLTV